MLSYVAKRWIASSEVFLQRPAGIGTRKQRHAGSGKIKPGIHFFVISRQCWRQA
jgi:hypothetical protein